MVIRNNAVDYLNVLIINVGFRGILKISIEIVKWFRNSKDIENEFKLAVMLMEKVGMGGVLFWNLYWDFLKESYDQF